MTTLELSKLRRIPLASTIALAVWGLGCGLAQAQIADDPSAHAAKAVAARATGRPAQELTVIHRSPLPNAGIERFKVLGPQGDVHGVDVDGFGNPVAQDVVEQAIGEINQRGFVGKLEKALVDRLFTRAAGPINAVLALGGPMSISMLSQGQTARGHAAHLAAVKGQVASTEQVVADELSRRGQRVIYKAEYAPLMVAAVDEPTIRAMEARDDVERIYLERVHQPRLNISRAVVQAHRVEARGITGTGVRVGVVEAGMIGPHPNLPASQRILCRRTPFSVASDHKTGVAGVIQSTAAARRGMAPSITVIDGIGRDFTDAEMMAATDCVINQGAVAVNMSFGSDTNGAFDAFARYVDATAYNSRRTIVVAVSNACNLRMESPEIAFNALAVGAFSDRNTRLSGDDRHTCARVINPRFSAFLDPLSPHSDREEPDVVAPGELIDMPLSGGGFGEDSGTSFAAAHVTAAIGLLQDRFGAFHTQPERARAIIMASARHNIEGASRLSERDGAGAILLAAADRILLNGQSWFVTKPGGSTGFPHNRMFAAKAGEVVRVVLVWAHKMPLGNKSTQPTTDLDLVVFQPNGAVIGSSASRDNTYEIVQFTAPVTGNYRMRINNFRPSPGTEYLGLAVSRGNA